jgi:short-subunit dehydrogenase
LERVGDDAGFERVGDDPVTDFARRYGPWALIAGASEGIGAAFATALAARGLNLVLVARRAGPLDELAARLPVKCLTIAADLATLEGLDEVNAATADLEIGLVVANAALAPGGRFIEMDLAEAMRVLELNCRATVVLARRLLPGMAARGRGGFIVMSSLAGMQGSPPYTTYAATKAFGAVLAEGLWQELRGSGVDVLACVAGAVATPGLARNTVKPAPGTVSPEKVVAAALHGLGRGPRTVPGAMMRLSSIFMSRLLPRRTAIAIISRASRDLIPPG